MKAVIQGSALKMTFNFLGGCNLTFIPFLLIPISYSCLNMFVHQKNNKKNRCWTMSNHNIVWKYILVPKMRNNGPQMEWCYSGVCFLNYHGGRSVILLSLFLIYGFIFMFSSAVFGFKSISSFTHFFHYSKKPCPQDLFGNPRSTYHENEPKSFADFSTKRKKKHCTVSVLLIRPSSLYKMGCIL